MRLFLASLLLVACVQQGGTPPAFGGSPPSQAALMAFAANTTVDLESADGLMFLQSSHTGFLEAPPSAAISAPRAAVRRPLFGRAKGHRKRPHQSAAARQARATGALPQITVRPVRSTAAGVPKRTQTLNQAFEQAYGANPNINRARADLRAADETVAVAKSGNRPTVTAALDTGIETNRSVNVPRGFGSSATLSDTRGPTRLSLDVSQPLFRGFRTRNATRQAEASVMAERQRLRATEQDVLLDTAVAFLDVRRFRDGVRLRQTDVTFLTAQVEAARARVRFGEGTSTDVDQAQARLADAAAALAEEISAKERAEAQFQEVTGRPPHRLATAIDITRLMPRALGEALRTAQDNNPNIHRAIHQADAANFEVRTLAGEALPSVSLNGHLSTNINTTDADREEAAALRLVVEVPIYQGGRVSAEVRRAKEVLGSARIGVDLARNEARSDVAQGFASYTAGQDTIRAAETAVAAARRAVGGVIDELKAGQRTTVDVLNAQRDLIDAEIVLIDAIRQRDSAAFVVLRATGALDIGLFGLDMVPHDPRAHYAAVRDRWHGMRTPDGR